MVKKISILFSAVIISFTLFAQTKGGTNENSYFIGINPLAAFTSVPNQYTNLYLPLATNLETGIALNGGIKINHLSYEGRLSIGYPNDLYGLFQFHMGTNYDLTRKKINSLYAGAFLKYYQLKNKKTRIHNYSLIPYLTIGYNYKINNYFIDLRLNQTVYAFSWSDQRHTGMKHDFHFSIWDEISGVLPYLSINIGYVFKRHQR